MPPAKEEIESMRIHLHIAKENINLLIRDQVETLKEVPYLHSGRLKALRLAKRHIRAVERKLNELTHTVPEDPACSRPEAV